MAADGTVGTMANAKQPVLVSDEDDDEDTEQ